MVEREGRFLAKDYHDLAIHGEHARFEIGAVTGELVERKWHEAYKRFYLRPKRIVRRALSPDTWRRLPMHLANFTRFFLGK